MNDLEIKNASIIDGLGNNSYQGNLYIKDGKIVAITHEETLEAKDSINANGKIVTPGFIDLHTHSDASFLIEPTAQSKVRQGVTLELIGNCGMSTCAPLIGESLNLFTCVTVSLFTIVEIEVFVISPIGKGYVLNPNVKPMAVPIKNPCVTTTVSESSSV